MRDTIDAPGEAADDRDALAGEVNREMISSLPSIGRSAARANDRNSPPVVRLEVAPHERDRRLVVDLLQAGRVLGVVPRVCLHARLAHELQLVQRVDLAALLDDARDG